MDLRVGEDNRVFIGKISKLFFRRMRVMEKSHLPTKSKVFNDQANPTVDKYRMRKSQMVKLGEF